jgi:hypothetical protein
METSEVHAVIRHQPVDRQVGFTDQEAIVVFIGHPPHLADCVVNLRLVHGSKADQTPGRRHPCMPVRIHRIVPQLCVLEQMVNGIDAEAVDAPCQTS